jgi:predicted amidohydrolase YtcJ
MTTGNKLMNWDFSEMLASKAHVTVGSDWSSGSYPGLLQHCAAVFAEVDEASAGRGGEVLCKMLTINGAQAIGQDATLGSIAVGKKANFIMVSRDLSRGDFDDAKVKKTWFEGELVWESPNRGVPLSE